MIPITVDDASLIFFDKVIEEIQNRHEKDWKYVDMCARKELVEFELQKMAKKFVEWYYINHGE